MNDALTPQNHALHISPTAGLARSDTQDQEYVAIIAQQSHLLFLLSKTFIVSIFDGLPSFTIHA